MRTVFNEHGGKLCMGLNGRIWTCFTGNDLFACGQRSLRSLGFPFCVIICSRETGAIVLTNTLATACILASRAVEVVVA